MNNIQDVYALLFALCGENKAVFSLILALCAYLLVVAIGALVNCLESAIITILSSLISPKAAFFAVNYLTFPGTIIHELSHAFFGFFIRSKDR